MFFTLYLGSTNKMQIKTKKEAGDDEKGPIRR
jgi:hypothetical protein